MRDRMRLGAICAICAALALLVAPYVAAGADEKIGRFSGKFKIQIGVDESGDPVYENCGDLTFHKTDSGKQWRLGDGCDGIIDMMVPPPTPVPHTPGPPVTPPPTPPGSAECPDGFFSKVSSGHYTLSNVTLRESHTHVFCVDLPAKAFPFFEIYTINKGNSSCSDLEMTAISPSGIERFTNGPAPVVRPNVQGGRWRVAMHLNWGCARYDFHVAY